MTSITQNDLHELLNYDEATGVFSWKKARKGVKVNKPLGTNNGFGYLRITVLGHSYYAHRLAWLYVHGHMPKYEIDHINGDKSDNRICNLRPATTAQNSQNKMKAQRNNKAGVLGISWHSKAGKWQVHICVCKKRKYLGLFDDIDEASKVYLEAKKDLHQFAVFKETT